MDGIGTGIGPLPGPCCIGGMGIGTGPYGDGMRYCGGIGSWQTPDQQQPEGPGMVMGGHGDG